MKTLLLDIEYYSGSAMEQVVGACDRIQDLHGSPLPVADAVSVKMDYRTYLEDISDWGHEWDVYWTVNIPDEMELHTVCNWIRFDADGSRRTRVKGGWLIPNELWAADLDSIWEWIDEEYYPEMEK